VPVCPKKLRNQFVERLTARFAANVPDFVALREMVEARGGRFHNDHGAIRVADPELASLFRRAARVIGLRKEMDYAFPDKKLVSFDLQVVGEDASQFKIFVSQVDLAAFPEAVAQQIREDSAAQAAAVDHHDFLRIIEVFESEGCLEEDDAKRFVDHFVDVLMRRNGPPIRRSTLEAVARVSGQVASALALGPDLNHVTIDVYAAGYRDIEEMVAEMRARGFAMLDGIQGTKGGPLRQTATLAATVDIPVLEDDGRLGTARVEQQFVEIIERNQAVCADGARCWTQEGKPLIYRNFLAANADRIFDAAAMGEVPVAS
jgi:uncharacterized glyoxalase superfamily metalloenzyme YdcJ